MTFHEHLIIINLFKKVSVVISRKYIAISQSKFIY